MDKYTLRKAFYRALDTSTFPDGVKFGQIRGSLRKEDSFCCLGVACEVHRQLTGEGYWRSEMFVDSEDSRRASFIPLKVVEDYDFDSGNPELLHKNASHTTSASNMNDNGDTFGEISGCFKDKFIDTA